MLQQDTDEHSMHTGCPVVEGVKWNAVKWLHGKPFRCKSGGGRQASVDKPKYNWARGIATAVQSLAPGRTAVASQSVVLL